MDIVFVHGWASGFFVWRDVANKFPEYKCHLIDLGFIGQEKINMPKGKFIGIGHSLGGQWLLKHHAENLSGFISIASFNNFSKYIPHQILAKMKENIATDVGKQIKDFWLHAGLNHTDGFKNTHPIKLIEGLNWLAKWDCNIPNIPIMALAAKDDQIVPQEMTQDTWGNHDLRWIEKGGHMIPLTQADWCAKQIREFIDAQE